jgi:ABC-type uncharacterized transport system substrate-binding protein
MLSGTLSISTAAVIFIIKNTKNRETVTPVNKEVLNIGFILNGDVSYTQEALEGFKDELDSLLLKTTYEANYEQVIGFAESTKEAENTILLNNLIQKFASNPDYIVSIGTEVTKVTKKNFLNKIPIIFTAVSYPIDDSIITTYSKDSNRGNMSGVAYSDPAKDLTDFLESTFPQKKFAFIYNPKYKQDLSTYKRLEIIANKSHAKISFIKTDTTKLSPKQIQQADIFFGRYYLITKLRDFLNNNQKPFIGNNILFVKQGALACIATPPKELGRLAAEKVLFPNLTKHISLSDIPIIRHNNPSTSFNLRAARKYNITIPQTAIDKAKIVIKQ